MELSKKLIHKIQSGQLTKFDLARKIGISRVTLDTRLEKGNWKKAELFLAQKYA